MKTRTQIDYAGPRHQRRAEWNFAGLRSQERKTIIATANAWEDDCPIGPFSVYYSDDAGFDRDMPFEYVTSIAKRRRYRVIYT